MKALSQHRIRSHLALAGANLFGSNVAQGATYDLFNDFPDHQGDNSFYAQGYAYWQLELVSDSPYYFSMSNTLAQASGNGVTQTHRFTNLSGPTNGNLIRKTGPGHLLVAD